MKKILYGFIGLFLVLGIVGGVTYALFVDTASVNGVVLGTATPGLVICHEEGSTPIACGESIPFPTDNPFGPLVPGGGDYARFYLGNHSNGMNEEPLDLNISAQITSAGGDWGILKDVIEMRFCQSETTLQFNGDTCVSGTETPWYTLSEWNSEARALKPNPLLQSVSPEYVRYTVLLRMGTEYDNTYSGKTITDMNWVFTGTQAL